MAAQSIVQMFYQLGGYSSESDMKPYIATSTVQDTYIPLGEGQFNSMCQTVKTASVGTSSWSTGDLLDDRIVAELALYFADSSYDTLHIDPDTYQTENRHYKIAEELILVRYGVRDKKTGDIILPGYANDIRAYAGIGISSLSY
jgi:hypothetical protein